MMTVALKSKGGFWSDDLLHELILADDEAKVLALANESVVVGGRDFELELAPFDFNKFGRGGDLVTQSCGANV